MREIKFKAKSLNTGKWVESMTIAKGTVKRKKDNYFMEIGEDKWIGIDPETICQYTGLKDKNGVEIYEGDICKIYFDINKVEDYIYNSLSKGEIETGTKIFTVDSPLFNGQPELNADLIEVIGNIYD